MHVVGQVYQRKWSFLAVFLLFFFTALSMLTALDLVPENKKTAKTPEPSNLVASVAGTREAKPELPTRVEIPAIGLKTTVANPTSVKVDVLDAALLKGAVRYPTSAELGQMGNVILFGHSSYLPVVNNKAYKAFNEIQNLTEGDKIYVYGEKQMYVYEVETVSQEDAKSAAIPLEVGEPTLTLATCDSFGEKTDRFVVVAKLVESRALAN